MASTTTQSVHGSTRGLDFPRDSSIFQGRFGRMFRTLDSANFSEGALTKLAEAMTAGKDPAIDGPDAEESAIPAAFTYFGQFVDHDITFDPSSSLIKDNDPQALIDYRSPKCDLDSVYGRGPDDQPYLYDGNGRFLLGRPLSGAALNPKARDLLRNGANPNRAIIGDPRNDENVLVSQLQGMFLRFHNALAAEGGSFKEIQEKVRFHYQWVILNDFLPRIVSADVMNAVLPHVGKGTDVLKDPPRLRFFHWRDEPYMPIEFSVAAYRYGHSMVRPSYRLNENTELKAIFDADVNNSLVGFREFPDDWAIDWSLLIDIDRTRNGDKERVKPAYRIDTSLVFPLGNLPDSVASDLFKMLALRNLLRGWRHGLPSGQTVAEAMGLEPLCDENISIGKFTGVDGDQSEWKSIAEVHGEFTGNAPLWAYILAETRFHGTGNTPKLGPVGGRIVAETFAGLLMGDSHSFLSKKPLWKPDAVKAGKPFGLRELLEKALTV
jgi:hypothetical protein